MWPFLTIRKVKYCFFTIVVVSLRFPGKNNEDIQNTKKLVRLLDLFKCYKTCVCYK